MESETGDPSANWKNTMKIVLVIVGFLVGYLTNEVIHLRQEYLQSVELAEARCNIFALSAPELELEPGLIDCKLIKDDDFLLTFEVNATAGYYVDCLPNVASFRREISLRKCRLYSP